MLSVACPGDFAWKVSVNTCPSPEMPLLPGGREAVNCKIPTMLSSRCTSATAWPSCESNGPLETFSSCKHVRVVKNLHGNGVNILSAGQVDVNGEGRAGGDD